MCFLRPETGGGDTVRNDVATNRVLSCPREYRDDSRGLGMITGDRARVLLRDFALIRFDELRL